MMNMYPTLAEKYAYNDGYDDGYYKGYEHSFEKAWNWIEDNMLSSNQQDKSRLYYKQFENYMKGGENEKNS